MILKYQNDTIGVSIARRYQFEPLPRATCLRDDRWEMEAVDTADTHL